MIKLLCEKSGWSGGPKTFRDRIRPALKKMPNISITGDEKSSFDKPEQLLPDESEMEAIWKSQIDLFEFLDPSKFKSLVEQTKRFNMVLGIKSNDVVETETTATESSEPKIEESTSASLDEKQEDEDDLSFFEDLIDDED